jgi:hypothetical protein
MMPQDREILIELRADIKYMKERFENSFARVEKLEADYVFRGFLGKILGLSFSLFLAVVETIRVTYSK